MFLTLQFLGKEYLGGAGFLKWLSKKKLPFFWRKSKLQNLFPSIFSISVLKGDEAMYSVHVC